MGEERAEAFAPEVFMLEIKGLKVSIDGTPVLKGVDLCLKKGESLALVGESGAGKTTLALSILGLAEGTVGGEVVFLGRNLLALSQEEMRDVRGKDISMVFQNVEDALHPLYRVREQVAEAISVHYRGSRGLVSQRALDLLESVGLDRGRSRAYPHQLSGGERQRALIAMALANDPRVLILDEPTASLDSLTKADIVRLLRREAEERISLVVTHDLSAAAALSENMAVLYAGRVLEMGPTRDLLTGPRHPYTRGLIRSYPSMTTSKDLQGIPGRMAQDIGGCPFHPRCTQRIEACSKAVPPLKDVGGRMIACHRGGVVPLIEIMGLYVSFDGHQVLGDLDLTLFEGETLALVGESGSGKTTLARAIMGLVEAESGEVCLEGAKVVRRDKQFYRRVQMIYQNPRESVSHRMTVLQAVKEPLDVHDQGMADERLPWVRQALKDVELPVDDRFLARYPHQLSGGEAQRLAIARAMVLNPKMLLADEPTSALDPSVQAKILRLMMKLQEERGLAVLLITHDLALARKVSDRVAVLLKGRIVETGAIDEVFARPRHPYTRRLIENASSLVKSGGETGGETDGGPQGPRCLGKGRDDMGVDLLMEESY